MSSATFDTHQLILTLKQAGFNDDQAEAVLETVKTAQKEADLATKTDLRELRYQLVISFGGMLTVAVVILAALIQLG